VVVTEYDVLADPEIVRIERLAVLKFVRDDEGVVCVDVSADTVDWTIEETAGFNPVVTVHARIVKTDFDSAILTVLTVNEEIADRGVRH
jgi:hypothetical protein